MKKITVFALVVFGLLMLAVPAVLAAVVADIDHETGDLSQYDAHLGNTSVVTPGLNSTLYMLSATNSESYDVAVKYLDSHKNRLRVRFYFDPNGVVASDTMAVYPFIGSYGGSWDRFGIRYYCLVAADCQMEGILLNDSDEVLATGYITITDSIHWVEIDYQRASGVGANDGFLHMWLDGAPFGEVDNVDNDLAINAIETLLFGFQTTYFWPGTLYVDEIIANDTGDFIGPGPVVPPIYPFRLYLPILYQAAIP